MDASFLVDRQIIRAVKLGALCIEDPDGRKLIDPIDGKPARDAGLDAHGYILHARRLYSWRRGASKDGKWINLKKTGEFTLHPDELVIIETYEHLSFSSQICGTIHALARLTLLGLSHISTTIHPGWGQGEGAQPLRIAICNLGNLKIEMRDKEPIARMLLYKSSESAEISAPRPEEVFNRSDNAIARHIKAATEQKRVFRITYLVLLTIFLIILQPLFVDGVSALEVTKAVVMALVGLWSAYLFKKLSD